MAGPDWLCRLISLAMSPVTVSGYSGGAGVDALRPVKDDVDLGSLALDELTTQPVHVPREGLDRLLH